MAEQRTRATVAEERTTAVVRERPRQQAESRDESVRQGTGIMARRVEEPSSSTITRRREESHSEPPVRTRPMPTTTAETNTTTGSTETGTRRDSTTSAGTRSGTGASRGGQAPWQWVVLDDGTAVRGRVIANPRVPPPSKRRWILTNGDSLLSAG